MRSLLLCLAICTLCACEKSTAPTNATTPPPPAVDVSHPIARTITEWDEYSGRFAAVHQVDVRARVSGYLDDVKFKEGQLVQASDLLFVIDPRPFEIALKAAESRFDLAQKELSRGKDLRQRNSLSQEQLDQRVNAFELAQAELNQAKLDLEFTQVKSPITGLVGRDIVNTGNLVNGTAGSATLLTTVVSIDPIHFYFEAGQQEYLRYSRYKQNKQRASSRDFANPVRVQLQDEDDFLHQGVMDFVDNRVDQSTGTIQGRAILDNEDGFLLPGLFGRIQLLSRSNVEAILVPDDIIGTNQTMKFVYVIDDNNTVQPKPVTLGKLYQKRLRVIESGLSPDDTIIVNGLLRARPGIRVAPNTVDIAAQYPATE